MISILDISMITSKAVVQYDDCSSCELNVDASVGIETVALWRLRYAYNLKD